MKKLLVCFVVLALSVNYALLAQEAEAEDEGIGLSVGVEFGVENANAGEDSEPYWGPVLIYEKSHFDGALDVYAEMDYYFYFNEDISPWMYFDSLLKYNIGLGEASTLSVLLRNENDIFFKESDANDGTLTPSLRFTQSLDFGDLYFQAGTPLAYIGDFAAGLDFTLGWGSTFGLGLKLVQHNDLTPESGYAGFDAILSYEVGSFYGEVEIDTYKEASAGVVITPYVEYFFDIFSIYAYCICGGVGGDGDASISPAIGVKLNF